MHAPPSPQPVSRNRHFGYLVDIINGLGSCVQRAKIIQWFKDACRILFIHRISQPPYLHSFLITISLKFEPVRVGLRHGVARYLNRRFSFSLRFGLYFIFAWLQSYLSFFVSTKIDSFYGRRTFQIILTIITQSSNDIFVLIIILVLVLIHFWIG